MITKKNFTFNAQVWRWPGDIGWHFVTLTKELSKKIKGWANTYGAGFIKVNVTVGKSTWTTALFPDKRSESYIMCIKKPIRLKEGIWEDDNICISFILL
ncbi:MAG: hypothetical protein UU06_C0023G0005 [Parcubacteria group bacterium GW2011_GWB1_40_5]|nr:MAG: hypothetical protein UU06_C0023G0005 [Parcubacteria group bacterium GW2011_GWB1_40_5]OHA86331.1 MAG: hypothetical protein A2123_01615 [Candidatus Zambryskibacteria bacterium GWB1_40_5]